ncbi:MAG TPA: hypothetical protein VH414_08545 [Lichenihabitans sp.]|nr:hypothetical protein [Lichenihabitans sp.]
MSIDRRLFIGRGPGVKRTPAGRAAYRGSLAAFVPTYYEGNIDLHKPTVGSMRFHYTAILFFALISTAAAQDAPAAQDTAPAQDAVPAQDVTAGDPFAKLPKPSTAVEYAATDTRVRFDFLTILNPDCSTMGNLSFRVLTKPEHGEISFVPDDSFPNFKEANVRSRCNVGKVHGLSIYYKSNDQFVGEDKATVLYLYPDASADLMEYEIIVR